LEFKIVYHDSKIHPAINFKEGFVKRKAIFGAWINLKYFATL